MSPTATTLRTSLRPVDAVRLQLVLLWVLLGSVAISALVSTSLPIAASPPPPTGSGSRPHLNSICLKSWDM